LGPETAGSGPVASISAARETLPYIPAAIVPLRRKAALFIEIAIKFTLQHLATQRGCFPRFHENITDNCKATKGKITQSSKFRPIAAQLPHLNWPQKRGLFGPFFLTIQIITGHSEV
jgi:hypothetical protein